MAATYIILLRLTSRFSGNLARPGVMDAIRSAAAENRPPTALALTLLGVPADFAELFIERLRYLLTLKQQGVLLSAGPFADLTEGMYVCRVSSEEEARRILLDDPLYQAGFIEMDFIVRQWLAAI